MTKKQKLTRATLQEQQRMARTFIKDIDMVLAVSVEEFKEAPLSVQQALLEQARFTDIYVSQSLDF